MTVIRALIMLITGAKMISGLPKTFTGIAQMDIWGFHFSLSPGRWSSQPHGSLPKKRFSGGIIFALGSNREAARLSGINIRRTTYGVYIFFRIVLQYRGRTADRAAW
jgi:ribose transport system permease protein